MDAVFRSKLNFKKFKESDFMKNKSIQYINSIPVNNGKFIIYTIKENKIKKVKLNKNEKNISLSLKDNINDKISLDQEKTQTPSEENDISRSGSIDTSSNNISSNTNNVKALNNILEETNSQASGITNSSGNSFWNLNKGIARYDKNNFSSKGFLNLQILLGGLILSLLILMVISILQLKYYEVLFLYIMKICFLSIKP